jgi:hypothetical protein
MPPPIKKQTDMMSLAVGAATLLVSADVLLFHMAMTAVRPKLQSMAETRHQQITTPFILAECEYYLLRERILCI